METLHVYRPGLVLKSTEEEIPQSPATARPLEKQTRALVSKETVVLRRWGGETQNFGFINWVDAMFLPLA